MGTASFEDRIAMASFFTSGALATMFGLFSVLGTVMGAGMTGMLFVTGDAEFLIAPVVFIAYGLFMVVCLFVGSTHLFAGYRLSRGYPKGPWLWIASGSGLLLALTVYCAPFGLISAALGVYAIISEQD